MSPLIAQRSSFLGRLWLWQKLSVLVAAMAVPVAMLGCFYFVQAAGGTHQAREELAGVRYLKALGNAASEMQAYRARAFALSSGDKQSPSELASAASEVSRQIAALDAVDAELGQDWNVSPAWQSIRSRWSALKAKSSDSQSEADDAAHAALAQRIVALTDEVSARSMASADPEPQTRALVRLASDYAPALLRYHGEIQRHALRAAGKGYLGGDDRMAIRVFRDRQLALQASVAAVLERMPSEVRAVLQPAVDAAISSEDAFFAVVQTKLLTASNLDVSPHELFQAGLPVAQALGNVAHISYDNLATRVEQRLTRLRERGMATAGFSAAALVAALALAWLINRTLSRRLQKAIATFGRIASGDYDNRLQLRGRDEAGQVLRALDQMQRKLRAQLETERAVAAENSRIRQALDKASTSVVLADSEHRIIYMNETAQASFARNQSEIRKSLPAFDAQRLAGSTLETLAADPVAERHGLDALQGSDTKQRTLGSLTFRTVTSPVSGAQGERIGTVMEWTERTQEVAIENQMQSMLAAVVDGDLGKRIALQDMTGFFEAASRAVNQLADNMAEIVSRVKDAAGEVYRGSKEISSGNSNLQMRTEEQAASLEETASSMETMTTTVNRNADNAAQANQLAIAAREHAEHGGAVVNKAVHAMSDINDSARRIADIIGVIDEIAFQTNLLALNAAVEAARAGEQGRGFAVVATEVRTLAGRSATAAKEIKELIQDSVRKVEDGSVLVTQSGQTLEQIVASVKKVSDIVAEIAAASREQSSGIAQVNRAVLQMDELTQQNAALVEQASSASQTMAQEAHALHEMMASYRLEASRRTAASPSDVVRASPVRASGESVVKARPRAPAASADSVATKALTPAVTAARRRGAVAPVDDGEWQEF